MHIEACKWYNDAHSPVLLMMDDLANTWVDTKGNGELELGGDWGYHKYAEQSAMQFLMDRILSQYPEVKVTFFVPVGERVGILEQPVLNQISLPINADEESKQFFRSVHEDSRFELAYHGTTHGRVGESAAEFVQEWSLFSSVEDARETIQAGMSIFRDAVGEFPQGGKYCGYESNDFSDDSIDESGFTWWCRYWNRGQNEQESLNIRGSDHNPLTNYDVKRFGKNNVVDIPSTLNGALLNGVMLPDASWKGRIKRMLGRGYIRWKLRQIDYLLRHRLVISIQEHIAPSRDDGKRQSPNILDDCDSLMGIFGYLSDKNVWHCTGSELARYVNVRDHTSVVQLNSHSFKLLYPLSFREQEISLRMSGSSSSRIRLPNQELREVKNGVANVPLQDGEYFMVEGDG